MLNGVHALNVGRPNQVFRPINRLSDRKLIQRKMPRPYALAATYPDDNPSTLIVEDPMQLPERQIRAVYDDTTIRVYQAFRDEIADAALAASTFISPPFKMSRMTWIKPSFLWMMYRAGWGHKDAGQKRILAIDISHEGFKWALAHSCPSHPEPGLSAEEWAARKAACPVRIQWDPERDLHHAPLAHRSIQIGLSGEAVTRYVETWIHAITDVTDLAHDIHALVQQGDLSAATKRLPQERPYLNSPNL